MSPVAPSSGNPLAFTSSRSRFHQWPSGTTRVGRRSYGNNRRRSVAPTVQCLSPYRVMTAISRSPAASAMTVPMAKVAVARPLQIRPAPSWQLRHASAECIRLAAKPFIRTVVPFNSRVSKRADSATEVGSASTEEVLGRSTMARRFLLPSLCPALRGRQTGLCLGHGSTPGHQEW